MKPEDIYELARQSPKGDWKEYSRRKQLLDETLTCAEYDRFIETLAEILRV